MKLSALLLFAFILGGDCGAATRADEQAARAGAATVGIRDPAEDEAVPWKPAPVWGLDFSPDGSVLAAAIGMSSEERGYAAVWKTEDWSLQFAHADKGGCAEVAFSPDGRLLAYGAPRGHIALLDVETGRLIRSWDAHENKVYPVAFTPDGGTIVSAGGDQRIKLWNTGTGELQRTLEGHTDKVYDAEVSPDGKLLLSGGADRTARLWHLPEGDPVRTVEKGEFLVRRIRFSKDGLFLLASRYDGSVAIRETATGDERARFNAGRDDADISRDNRLVAGTGSDRMAHVFRTHLSAPTKEERVRVQELIAKFDDDRFEVREAASREIVDVGMVAEPMLRKAMDSPSAEVRMRALEARLQVRSPEPVAQLGPHDANVEVVRFSPDGSLLVTASRGGDVRVWNTRTFEQVKLLDTTFEDDPAE